MLKKRKKPTTIEALKKKGITNSAQLHRWFPLRYINNIETGIRPEYVGLHVSVCGYVQDVQKKLYSNGRKGFYLVCHLIDRISETRFTVTIFQGYTYYDTMMKYQNNYVVCSGILDYNDKFGYSLKLDTYADKCMISNDFNLYYNQITPVFSKIKDVPTDDVFKMIGSTLLNQKEDETVPDYIRDKFGLMEINEALWNMNFPVSYEAYMAAKKRLLFDDLYYMASRFTLSAKEENENGIKTTKTDFTDSIIASLPYELTEDQRKVYEKIKEKMLAGEHVSALVQGDVSCGKTITAILAAFLAMENGFQAIIMAPTKILATQHFEEVSRYLEGTDYKAELLAGTYLTQKFIKGVKNGNVNIVIGTSQVLSDTIEYLNLGLFIVDEEHKFGVDQREKLTEKAKGIDYISMSATPIPRTLAKSMYSENTDIFEIHSMPGGRKPVKTFLANENLKYSGMAYALSNGHQAYVVCPAIDKDDENEKFADVMSTKEALERYRAAFPGYVIEELNGKMSKTESEDIISRFKAGEINVLVSTTIIEVGVNVPNATYIVIENAERFGLAQMHQLRGRVGRGSEQSYCALSTNDLENERLQVLCNTNDGFKIAEADLLHLRKSGDLFGSEQSGFNRYVEELWTYKDLYDSVVKTIKEYDTSKDILQKHIDKMIVSDMPKMKFFDIAS
ncbi:MAG: DEAD/DEAH box helicase [Clostridium sp.]|nr:DEAD/DEAH box helicase [Clostridium sp.]